ncbi:hypothetical protein EDEG_03651 [Edhazardia aedis USNM 41457]|uniref:Uncharacterized protein n=1 Tax=Edhazardia aedis (strain USNM 41457) TaxID=1003232 RepID=J9DKG5_EDHAE|nr:hypothetical protein EDEG_03651 [Edhazardia aedis USNM 41457]|eukprot:EJW01877.1 hypothetical protein EDEG_03651 [Edhazardia aedis USNM 41457]
MILNITSDIRDLNLAKDEGVEIINKKKYIMEFGYFAIIVMYLWLFLRVIELYHFCYQNCRNPYNDTTYVWLKNINMVLVTTILFASIFVLYIGDLYMTMIILVLGVLFSLFCKPVYIAARAALSF